MKDQNLSEAQGARNYYCRGFFKVGYWLHIAAHFSTNSRIFLFVIFHYIQTAFVKRFSNIRLLRITRTPLYLVLSVGW